MGVQIRTIVKDNVATRCDGCLEVIHGTPWRINPVGHRLPGVGGRLDGSIGDQAGPFQVYARTKCA